MFWGNMAQALEMFKKLIPPLSLWSVHVGDTEHGNLKPLQNYCWKYHFWAKGWQPQKGKTAFIWHINRYITTDWATGKSKKAWVSCDPLKIKNHYKIYIGAVLEYTVMITCLIVIEIDPIAAKNKKNCIGWPCIIPMWNNKLMQTEQKSPILYHASKLSCKWASLQLVEGIYLTLTQTLQ